MSSNHLDPARSHARQNTIVGVSTALTIVSVLIVSLRLYVRTIVVRHTGKDDWAMVTALFFTLAYLAAIYVLRENGMGYSGAVLNLSQMTNTLKTTLAVEILYYICVNAIKVSIVLFYLRIGIEKPFVRMCQGTIAFIATFCVVCIIVCLTQCVPLHKMWDLTGMVQGTCIDSTAFFYMTSGTNIIIDLWIIVLPIKVLSSIQRPRREKFALVGVFMLGAFACIASIIRLYSIRIYTMSKDPFYDSVPINNWSMVEVNVGIWCASIPALKALFSKKKGRQNTGYQYGSQDTKTFGSKVSGYKKMGFNAHGVIVRDEEFVMETSRRDDGPAQSQERIMEPGRAL